MLKFYVCAMAALTTAAPASAQDRDGTGVRKGDVLVRARAILVAPNERSSDITPTFPGEKVRVDAAVMPEVDATYMATDHLGLELIASTTKHVLSGRTGTTGSIGRLATSWVLPPTLTAQYHFAPRRALRPYVGAGINYTIFWNEEASAGLEAAAGKTRVHLSDSVGWAVQAGLDMDLTRTIFLNLDVKYIDMDTKAHLATSALGKERVHVRLDPLVVGVGVGMRL